MWRCVCGHAVYSALPPACPCCERPVDADAAETVLVEGRLLPYHVWEAEVLVRAAGWAAVLQGTGILLGALGLLAFGHREVAAVGGLGLLLLGAVFLSGGWLAFRRQSFSRWLLFFSSKLMVALVWVVPFLTARRGIESWPVLLPGLAAQVFTWAFTLIAILSRGGDWVFELAPPSEPLAPLSSAWKTGGSIRAWAAVGMICLAGLGAATAVGESTLFWST